MSINLEKLLDVIIPIRPELIVLGARPGIGKSTTSLQIANHIASENISIAIFNLETSKETIIKKISSTNNIYIDDTPNITISYIEEKCRKLVQEHNVKFIIIDYLQLIKGYNQEETEISSRLKALVDELQVTILLLSQLTRDIENREVKIPKLEDIKNTKLKTMADMIAFLYKEPTNEIEIVIAKQREITFESVEERIKNKKLDELTKADVFDRYFAYGEDKEISDPRIQKLLTKYGYIDELIWTLKSVVIDKEVIESILASEVIKDENTLVKTGKIKELYFIEDNELPKDFNWLYIKFIDENNIELTVKDMHHKKEPREFEIDNYAELKKYKNDKLTIIIEKVNNEMRLRCALKRGE